MRMFMPRTKIKNEPIHHSYLPHYKIEYEIDDVYWIENCKICGANKDTRLDHYWSCECGMKGNGENGHSCQNI